MTSESMMPVPSPELMSYLATHAERYELAALLKAVRQCGFDWNAIRFEGIRQLEATRTSLVRGLRVEERPRRVAVISLNAGLLAADSPLPEYFRDFARRLPDPDDFVRFLGFLDAAQLQAWAYALLVELGIDERRSLGRAFRARVHLGSPMSLHWLFRGMFPELPVEVAHARFARLESGARARMGTALTGSAVLGSLFRQRCDGFRVKLHAEGVRSEGVENWEDEALRRIREVEGMLARIRAPLEIVLSLHQYEHGHRLVGDSSQQRQLGVRPWLRSERGEQAGPATILLRDPWNRLRAGTRAR